MHLWNHNYDTDPLPCNIPHACPHAYLFFCSWMRTTIGLLSRFMNYLYFLNFTEAKLCSLFSSVLFTTVILRFDCNAIITSSFYWRGERSIMNLCIGKSNTALKWHTRSINLLQLVLSDSPSHVSICVLKSTWDSQGKHYYHYLTQRLGTRKSYLQHSGSNQKHTCWIVLLLDIFPVTFIN